LPFIFQTDPETVTHNQNHKGKRDAGGYSCALQRV
jgi:hypothetical protein